LEFLAIDRLLLVLGIALQAGCIALAVWARRHLGRNWSGAVRIVVDHQLYQRDSWALIPFVI
jgi:protein-S-isoprenylcysteine O-methyltransferase Ste14